MRSDDVFVAVGIYSIYFVADLGQKLGVRNKGLGVSSGVR